MLTGKKTIKTNIIALIIILGICSIDTGTAFAADMEQRQEIALDSEKDAVKILNQETEAETSIDALTIDSLGRVTKYESVKNPLGTKVVIPESITTSDGRVIDITAIGERAFRSKGLTEVVLSNGITEIAGEAFEGNSITKVTFPTNDIIIGKYAFKNNAFTSFTITSNMKINSFKHGIFEGNTSLESVTFEDGTDIIPQSMFTGCTNLANVVLPSTIKQIDSNAFTGTKIENITLPHGLERIGSSAFYQAQLKEIVIPNTVTVLDSSAFQNNQLQTVVLSNQLTRMGIQCFQANQIKEVEIPASLEELPTMAFYQNKLEKVTLHKGLKQIGDYAFYDGNKIKDIVIPEGIQTIGTAAFAENNMESVTLNEGVRTIKKQAFAINKIRTLKLPTTLTVLGVQAFGANSLSFVEIPAALTTLDASAFLQQANVPSVYVQRNDKYIYQIPDEVDETIITEVKGYAGTSEKNIVLNVGEKQFTSDELLTKIVYKVELKNDTVSAIMDIALVPQIKKHHVVLKDFDNTVLGEYDIEDNQALENVPAPSRAGYTFIGWDYPTSNIQEDLTITAQYKQFPVVEAKLIRIEEGSNFNPKDYIVVKDADGNNVQAITITKNNVDVQRPGKYAMEFKATDIWGGEVVGVYQVEVYSKVIFEERRITDKISGISIEGSFVKDARVIVELTPVPAPSLNDKVADKEFINAFEVRVLGEYRGKLKVKFPLDKKLNGTDIYIYHEKKDGTIEEFKKSASGGAVEIMVDELSPFVLAKEKVQKPDTKPDAKPDTKPGNKPGTTPTDATSDSVKTGDQRNTVTPTIWLLVAGIVILVTLRGKYTKN